MKVKLKPLKQVIEEGDFVFNDRRGYTSKDEQPWTLNIVRDMFKYFGTEVEVRELNDSYGYTHMMKAGPTEYYALTRVWFEVDDDFLEEGDFEI